MALVVRSRGGLSVVVGKVRVGGGALRVTTVRGRAAAAQGPTVGVGSSFEPAPLADEAGRGCLVARADLDVITGAQAATMRTIDGYLVLGRFTAHKDGVEVTNSRVEAVGNVTGGSGVTSALIARQSGNGPVIARHVTVSGLERDSQGRPVRMHMVNRGVTGGSLTFEDGVIDYTNDGLELSSNTTIRRSVVTRHADAVVGGTRQHPDGGQGQQGGNVLVEDTTMDGAKYARPTLPDGTPVPGTDPAGGSGIMLNHDRPWTGPVVLRRVRFPDSANVGLNVAGGTKPRYGDAYADGLEWTAKRYDGQGNLTQGLLVEDCEWAGDHKDFMIRARAELLRETFPQWGGSRKDSSGPSTWGRYRNDDGTYRDLPPAAIYGT